MSGLGGLAGATSGQRTWPACGDIPRKGTKEYTLTFLLFSCFCSLSSNPIWSQRVWGQGSYPGGSPKAEVKLRRVEGVNGGWEKLPSFWTFQRLYEKAAQLLWLRIEETEAKTCPRSPTKPACFVYKPRVPSSAQNREVLGCSVWCHVLRSIALERDHTEAGVTPGA